MIDSKKLADLIEQNKLSKEDIQNIIYLVRDNGLVSIKNALTNSQELNDTLAKIKNIFGDETYSQIEEIYNEYINFKKGGDLSTNLKDIGKVIGTEAVGVATEAVRQHLATTGKNIPAMTTEEPSKSVLTNEQKQLAAALALQTTESLTKPKLPASKAMIPIDVDEACKICENSKNQTGGMNHNILRYLTGHK